MILYCNIVSATYIANNYMLMRMNERERHCERERHLEREPNTVRERNIGREPNTERVHDDVSETEWMTVRHRKNKNLPPRRYGRSGTRQEDHPHRRNWRDRTEITSFYFTRFTDEVTEMEL